MKSAIPWQAATTTGWMMQRFDASTAEASTAIQKRPSSSAGLSRSSKEKASASALGTLQVEDLDSVPTIVCNSGNDATHKNMRVPFNTSLDHDFLRLFAT